MYFNSFSELFTMGRHGVYVWSVYGLILLSLIGIHIYARLRHRRLQRQLAEMKAWGDSL